MYNFYEENGRSKVSTEITLLDNQTQDGGKTSDALPHCQNKMSYSRHCSGPEMGWL
jgi:hypothetical protein